MLAFGQPAESDLFAPGGGRPTAPALCYGPDPYCAKIKTGLLTLYTTEEFQTSVIFSQWPSNSLDWESSNT